MSHSHLIVGAGRMGGALLSGWLSDSDSGVTPQDLIILDPHPGDAAKAAIAAGALHMHAPDAQLRTVHTVLLAVKPQMFATLGDDIAKHLPNKALIISIMAGTSLGSLDAVFAPRPIIRAMPNTPAAIGAGITAFTSGPGVSKEHATQAEALLAVSGPVYAVENEHVIDVVTAVSGSGPAYVFHMVEALEAAAREIGLPDGLAPDFARQTIIGAGALLAQSPDSASDLRRAVTSPNGTTQAALEVLMREEAGLPDLMAETVKAALARAKALAETA